MRPRCFNRDPNRRVATVGTVNVQRCFILLFASLFVAPAINAAVCDPRIFQGAYGLFLTGDATIGGSTRPAVVVGRLVLDDAGNLSGVSSTSFMGLILGNPVTGIYEAQADCSVTWSLQDDSGAFQHFAGSMSDDGDHVAFRQTDPGGARNGSLFRTMNGCSESSLTGEFNLTVSGSTVDVGTAAETGRISFSGVLMADGAGGLSFPGGPREPPVTAGSYDVQDDCFVELELKLASGNETVATHFRTILVDKGRKVVGIQTDSGSVVVLRLVAR